MLKLSDRSGSKTDTKILLDAISKDKVHLTRFILDALDGKIIDSKTEGAQTPLISAVFLQDPHSRSKFMNLLLQRGANVNHPDESGRTALSYACEMGYLDAVKILVKNNADPEVADIWGNTALMYAAVAGHSAIVEFLVRAFKRLGLQIDRQNKVGNSAFEVAKYLGHTDCLQALVSNSKRHHDGDVLAEKLSAVNVSADDNVERSSESFLEHLLSKEIHPTLLGKRLPEDGTQLPISLGRKRSLILRNRIQSMGSIEEYERESDASAPSTPQGLVFSGVLTPKPPQKLSPSPKHGEQLSTCPNSHLPPLIRDLSMPVFYSPRPSKTPSRTPPSGTLTGPLGILLTPIGKSGKEELDKAEKAKKLQFELPIRRFDDSYYQKRCSLPTSTLASGTSERHLMSLHKSKTMSKSPPNTETLDVPVSPQSSSSFSALSSRLLRRFTFPDFKKSSKELQEGCGAANGVSELPRSETFPLANNHPQVGNKPSIDSISAVKCEFDFQFKGAQNF
ncbi:ankyrin repeat domain-containing protein 34B-like [Myxocyprinus asiaticus]|uniref:ankyrin repeat domain-containing protein 34B-like n=1 Tax=Myxocyprinus asiaticus TaxID=70543 RepID=UPI0022222055|nr:ankyrin repeat domain-containing protein 34B-like [Myxocyprinus asiaticus]